MSSFGLRLLVNKSSQLKVLHRTYSSFISSPFLEDLKSPKVKYEVSKSPEEWKYVERVLPPTIVPPLVPKEEYPSGFKPQSEHVKSNEYYIPRSKNHMPPVYLKISQRGIKRLTYVRKIEGDIWKLSKELETFLQPMSKSPLRLQVNEFVGYICINGDYVNAIKHWLMERGY